MAKSRTQSRKKSPKAKRSPPSSKQSYGKKLSSSWDRGRRCGFDSAPQHSRAPGSYIAAGTGYYVGLHDRRKVENAKKTAARYKH